MRIIRPLDYCSLSVAAQEFLSFLSSQAKGEEAVSIPAQFKDGLGSDGGRRPEHRNGVGREAEGGPALVCVREAVLHQHAGTRRTHELLNSFLHLHFNGDKHFLVFT